MSSTSQKQPTQPRVTPSEVRKLIEPVVQRHQAEGFRLILKKVRYNPAVDRWVIYFDTDPEDVDVSEFADRLTEIEEEVAPKAKKQKFSIFLTSVGNPEF